MPFASRARICMRSGKTKSAAAREHGRAMTSGKLYVIFSAGLRDHGANTGVAGSRLEVERHARFRSHELNRRPRTHYPILGCSREASQQASASISAHMAGCFGGLFHGRNRPRVMSQQVSSRKTSAVCRLPSAVCLLVSACVGVCRICCLSCLPGKLPGISWFLCAFSCSLGAVLF